jgi:PAS domain S-box-containing protein
MAPDSLIRNDNGSGADSDPVPAVFSYTYIWVGILFGLLFWPLESVIHVLVFTEDSFISQLLTLDPHELWKRILIFALLSLFGAYAQHGINVRRRSEQAVRVSEKKYRTLIEEALNPIFVFDIHGSFLDFNQSTLNFFELDRDELLATTYQEVTAAYPQFSKPDGKPVSPSHGLSEMDFVVGATTKTLLLNIVPLATEIGELPSFFGIGQDITERKQFQQNLQLAHKELTQIFQTASSAMRMIDREFRVIKVNETFVELAGVPAEDAIGRKCFNVFAGDRCNTPECPLVQILDGKKKIEYRINKKTVDGTELTCLLTARPFFNSKGDPIGIVESFNDVTELTHTQDALRTERDKLRNILFQQYEGVGILRSDFTVEYQNEALVREFGDCIDRHCYEAFVGGRAPCRDCRMRDAIETDTRHRYEVDSPGGRVFEHTYTPFRDIDDEQKVLVYLRDITEARASHAAAVQSEQLAAIGALAAGVAHEINNPINGIINYGHMLTERERGLHQIRDISGRIVKEGDRIARIVASLLSYARRGTQEETASSVEELVNESLTLIGAQMRKESIKVDVRIEDDLPRVFCVPQEIQQVFLNVIGNARDALNRRDPENETDKRLEILADIDESDGDRWVRVIFRDNGTGIPESIRGKIMKPFFSTKPKGKGTGLGLSISHDIVRENGGELTIESEFGSSTTVNIRLPEVTM